MKKALLIGGAIVVIIIVAFLADKPSNDSEPTPNTNTETEAESVSNNGNSDTVQRNQPAASATTGVFINERELSTAQVAELKNQYGVDPVPGRYWYDSRSGAFGNMGGPVVGVMFPGHEFGPLPANPSNGTSGVFYNGRQLTQQEAVAIAGLFGVAPIPGRYWFDSYGNVGVEDSNTPLVNVYAAAALAGGAGGGGGDNFWSQGLYSAGNYYTGAGGAITEGYVSVPGYGPVSHGF